MTRDPLTAAFIVAVIAAVLAYFVSWLLGLLLGFAAAGLVVLALAGKL